LFEVTATVNNQKRRLADAENPSPVAPRVRVRVPECFGACKEKQPEEALVASFRLLDPQAKDLVLMTAQRMGRA
jgi:hypothetical protein